MIMSPLVFAFYVYVSGFLVHILCGFLSRDFLSSSFLFLASFWINFCLHFFSLFVHSFVVTLMYLTCASANKLHIKSYLALKDRGPSGPFEPLPYHLSSGPGHLAFRPRFFSVPIRHHCYCFTVSVWVCPHACQILLLIIPSSF